jgi:hypothetical protein
MPNAAGMTSAQASTAMDASMGASAFTAIAGGFENAAALKAQGSYASSIANTNASLANLKASQTLQAGDVAASRKQLETEGAVGSARAAGGASGVDVNRGSPAMTQASIGTAGATDVNTIKMNAARAAWGYQTQATEEQYTGQIQQLTAKQRAIQSLATGGIQAVAGPLGMYSQAALWQYRYGGRGTPGIPFPGASMGGGGTAAPPTSDSDDFWTGQL